jgi:hypothetical protein
MVQFEWMFADSNVDYYSHWFKKLLETGVSKMTAHEYRNIAKAFGGNIDEDIAMIEKLRADLKQELIDAWGEDVENFTDMPMNQYLMNAFPYESLLMIRY